MQCTLQAAGFGRFANVSRQLDLAVDDSCLPSDMTFPFELLRGASTSPLTSMSMMRLPATTEEQRCTQPPNQCNAQAEMKEDPASKALWYGSQLQWLRSCPRKT